MPVKTDDILDELEKTHKRLKSLEEKFDSFLKEWNESESGQEWHEHPVVKSLAPIGEQIAQYASKPGAFDAFMDHIAAAWKKRMAS